MNKIIINGIDVSECPLYDKNTGCYHTFNGECVKDSCAVYKWLLEYKRLQEENEKLKKRQITKNGFICDCEQNAKYKQALEEIRDIAQIHQYFNPELLEIKGDIGQMQDLKMTEIFKKCNEVLNDRD